MVRYPDGRCSECGERIFSRIEGTFWCPNCGREFETDAGHRCDPCDDS